MKKQFYLFLVSLVILCFTITSCQSSNVTGGNKKNIVVTYSVLGTLVQDLVRDKVNVTISVPNGLDPHDWEPSAKDIESLNKADLIIENGLNFESGLLKTIAAAKAKGVKVFTASDHITVRTVGEGEFAEENEHEHEHPEEEEHEEKGEEEEEHEHHHEVGSPDPHLWTDPVGMKAVINALSEELKQSLDIDVSNEAATVCEQLDKLDQDISSTVSSIPQSNRKFVTGHNSMGYYAQRYGFQVIGAIIPSISTQAEVSAADLANLKHLVEEQDVPAIFTELGTNPSVAQAIGNETGVKVVELASHLLPDDGSYITMMENLTHTIANALK